MTKKSVFVHVPATSGNLGPGLDVLGMALNFGNDLQVRILSEKSSGHVVRIMGEGETYLPRNEKNLIFKAFKLVFLKAKARIPQVEMRCLNRIPLERGLGSSSAAVLSGMLAANALLKNKFSDKDILYWATELEGHPDNVSPAFYGGVRASAVVGKSLVSLPWPLPKLNLVVAVPDFHLSTEKSRKAIPAKIPIDDAIANLAAVALMPSAFMTENGLLKELLQDRWHEPFRARLIPGFNRVKKAALAAGAAGVTLSGAGPSILSFSTPSRAAKVASAMRGAFLKSGIQNKIMKLKIDRKGAIVR